MKHVILPMLFVVFTHLSFAQEKKDSTQQQIPKQSSNGTAQEAVYRRPFITSFANTSIGGYAEANTNYFSENGISEGFSMEMRRFNIFLYSSISSRVKLLAELEFEHGAEEISLETAQIDFEIDPALTLRGGILLAPIGGYNQRHDSPLYEFVERPLVTTQIIPTTLSEIGFGAFGRFFFGDFIATYDAYIVNGLRDGVILNGEGRTFLQAGKSKEMFGESHNGVPFLTGKVALRHRKIGEIGVSYYGGVYNSFRKDGIVVDKKRSLQIAAVDFNATLAGVLIQGEVAMNSIDVPESLGELYGRKQWGGYVDIIVPVLRFAVLEYENAVLNANIRLERIDYNVGTFSSTGDNVFDDVTAIAAGVSFRPTAQTVVRANYRYHWINDLLGNATVRRAGFQVGIATYF